MSEQEEGEGEGKRTKLSAHTHMRKRPGVPDANGRKLEVLREELE